jgi:FKBP-type peptidyl-prolyl cis-trans isomerase
MKIYFILLLLLVFAAGCKSEGDVETTPSGLQYVDDTKGSGDAANMGDMVTIHFDAWMVDDAENQFNDWEGDTTKLAQSLGSSRQFNQPLKFILGENSPIKGIDEGIVGMQPGGTRTIIIPSDMAYGEQGMGPIPPNTNLKIVVELIESKEPVHVEMWDADTTDAQTTASGLQYIILEDGSGTQPVPGDTVEVHYTGWLEDGTKFDSSLERDETFVFVIGQGMVIKGWDEGIALLKEGSKARLIIPPHLGYGERAIGLIPENSTLYFDVELIDVK